MTAAAHVHVVDREFRILLLGVCVCGEEYDQLRGEWRAPKRFEGMRRRFAWEEKQRLATVGDQ